MEIKEVRKLSLHNMEHYQFATQVIKLCEEAGIEKLKTLLKTLKDAVAEEDKALNIPRKKEERLIWRRSTAHETMPIAHCSCWWR